MKGSVIALDTWNGARAAALVVDGRLEDILVDPPGDAPPAPGTVFRAVADRPMKGQGGVFVTLPEGQTGFLRVKEAVKAGQSLLVQVTGFGEPGKAVPLTTKLIFKGRYVLVTPGAPGINVSRQIRNEEERIRLLNAVDGFAVAASETGLIVRSQAVGSVVAELAAEAEQLIGLAQAILADRDGAPERLLDGPDAHALALRDWRAPEQRDIGPGAFARHGIDEMVAAVRAARVDLPGGASAWIEPTRALVAVDVNTGGDTSPAAGLKANIALARDLPRQLRCRGLGGQITIDFAPMPKRDRRQIEQVLRSAFRGDGTETALVGWTPLGHYELQRKRDRLPLT